MRRGNEISFSEHTVLLAEAHTGPSRKGRVASVTETGSDNPAKRKHCGPQELPTHVAYTNNFSEWALECTKFGSLPSALSKGLERLIAFSSGLAT